VIFLGAFSPVFAYATDIETTVKYR
jgi:hypothetical protein